MGRGQPRTPLRALQPPGGFGGSDKGVWLGFEGLCGLGRAVVGVPGDCHLAGTPGAGGFGGGVCHALATPVSPKWPRHCRGSATSWQHLPCQARGAEEVLGFFWGVLVPLVCQG